MAIVDGYTATHKIREYLYTKNLKQPIITAVTGHLEQSYVKKAFQSGMNQVVSKPISHHILKNIL